MKKIFGLLFSLVVLLGCVLPSDFASAKENNKGKEKMVQVVLYSSDDQVVISEVPKSYEKEYLAKLKDPEFKNGQIQNSLGGTTENSLVSVAAASSYVKYYRKAEVIKMVDHMDNTVNWSTYVSNPLTDALIGKAVALITKSNFIGVAVAATAWTAADLSNRQVAWWKDSAIMILRKQITGVKLTVTPGPPSGYPAAYITLTRY